MKQIVITRQKHFASALMPYWIIAETVVEAVPERFQPADKVRINFTGHAIPVTSSGWLENNGVQIVNGETVTVHVPNDVQAIYAVTADGILSNRAVLSRKDAESDAFQLTLSTRGGLLRPSYPWFLTEEA